MNEHLIHYNHNHDKLGRFATAAKGSSLGSSFTIKTGTEVQRLQGTAKEKHKGKAYASVTDLDKKIYQSVPHIIRAKYNVKYDTIKDIHVAGRDAKIDAFVKVYENNSVRKLTNDQIKVYDKLSGKYVDKNERKRKYEETKRAYENADKDIRAFIAAYRKMDETATVNTRTSKQYLKELQKAGYDALLDEHDIGFVDEPRGIYKKTIAPGVAAWKVRAEKPVIFIDRKESLQIKDIKAITKEDVESAQDWMKKKGYWRQMV